MDSRCILRAAQADVPAMGWRRLGLTLDGTLQRDDRQRWILDGEIRLANAPGGALSDAHVNVQLSEAANTLLVDILQGKARVSTALPLDQPTHAQIRLDHLPAGWLQGLLGTVWSGRPTGGRLDAELALDLRDAGHPVIRAVSPWTAWASTHLPARWRGRVLAAPAASISIPPTVRRGWIWTPACAAASCCWARFTQSCPITRYSSACAPARRVARLR